MRGVSVPRTLLGLVGIAGAGLAAERLLARRVRSRTAPEADRLLRPPDDVGHHTIPTHDGGSLHVVERGQGRPLVLLHGIMLNAELWSPQLHGLADGFRVLAVDLRGHGRSRAGTDGYGMEVLGRDVATILTELDLHNALVVGHSMGGMATLTFALDHPDLRRERVAGLGLVATAAAQLFPNALVPRMAALGGLVVERLDSGRPVPALRFTGNDLSLFLCRAAFGKHPSAAAVEQVRASIEATDDDALHRSAIGILDHHATDRLGEIDTPAFVVVGRRDILTPATFGRRLAERLPDAELTVLAGAGHQLMQERPDALGGLIRDLAARTAPVRAEAVVRS